MLLSVMVLGGIMVSATVIAGLLTSFQARQVNDAVSSARALFVSDAGIELAAWQFFRQGDPTSPDCSIVADSCTPINFDDPTAQCNIFCEVTSVPNETLRITVEGFSGRTTRIVESHFSSASSTNN